MDYAIEVENLNKSFKGIKAVDNLCLKIPEGKIYGFLGKNGAGKTTTISMIVGIIKPDSGSVKIFGKDAADNRKWASRNIGCIVETPGFYENLTAYENLDITRELYGADKKRIEEVLNIVKLHNLGSKKVKKFSLGMKQRLGIANALMHSPGILILDEPANGLDPAGIKDMRMFLKELAWDCKITIMVSSHILSEVQRIADVVGIVDKGSLVEQIDINMFDQEDQSYLMLEVDDREEALKLIRHMDIKCEVENGYLKVYCKKDMNASINRHFVINKINVFNLSSVKNSLEERFFSVIDENMA